MKLVEKWNLQYCWCDRYFVDFMVKIEAFEKLKLMFWFHMYLVLYWKALIIKFLESRDLGHGSMFWVSHILLKDQVHFIHTALLILKSSPLHWTSVQPVCFLSLEYKYLNVFRCKCVNPFKHLITFFNSTKYHSMGQK